MNGGSTQVRIVSFRVKIASLKNITTLHGELLADQVGSSGGAVLGQRNVDPSHLGKLSR